MEGPVPPGPGADAAQRVPRTDAVESVPPPAGLHAHEMPGSILGFFASACKEANKGVRVDLADGSFWIYQYDALGQVISGKRYWSDGTPVAGQQFEYGFDDIGNRKVARRGGDENGWNLRERLYGVDVLKQ